MKALDRQIKVLEQAIVKQAKLDPRYPLVEHRWRGRILVLAIMLDTGDIERFAQEGNFTSFAAVLAVKD